jgi:hypothetical protein
MHWRAHAHLAATPQPPEPAISGYQPTEGETVAPLQGGMDNATLLAAWQKKLPGVEPKDQELSAFAVGVEVGFEHARKLEKADWMRVHYALKAAGVHPGRTDEHLADVIARTLNASQQQQAGRAEAIPTALSVHDKARLRMTDDARAELDRIVTAEAEKRVSARHADLMEVARLVDGFSFTSETPLAEIQEKARAALAAPPPPMGGEPVAFVGSGFQLLWTGGASFAEHAQRYGIKVGTKLYTSPMGGAAEGEPIDYDALIAAAAKLGLKQGTRGCVAFASGAEWLREQVLSAAPQEGSQP